MRVVALTKSAKGLAELNSGDFTLDLRCRQVLILADGKNTVATVRRLRPSLDVEAIVSRLTADGYLVGSEVGRSVRALRAANDIAPAMTRPEDARAVAEARHILIESLQTHVGVLGADLMHRIQRAEGADQLRGCLAHWHMSMCDSRSGRVVVEVLLEQVEKKLSAT